MKRTRGRRSMEPSGNQRRRFESPGRRSVEPSGHQRRRSESPERKPTRFFKIILHDTNLRIPEWFSERYGEELSDVATVTVPNSRVWQVGLEKDNQNTWFHNGWQDFIEYYSIHYGYLLMFEYEGNSNFHVLIFDTTASEIHYPCNGQSSDVKTNYGEQCSTQDEEETEEEETEDDESYEVSISTSPSPSRCSSDSKDSDECIGQWKFEKGYNFPSQHNTVKSYFGIRRKKYTSWTDKKYRYKKNDATNLQAASTRAGDKGVRFKESKVTKSAEDFGLHSSVKTNHRTNSRHGFVLEDEDDTEMFDTSKFSRKVSERVMRRQMGERARRAAKLFEPQNPFFKAEIRRHNLYNSFVYVPAGFGTKYLGNSEYIQLQASDGKQWLVRCYYRDGSGSGRSIGKGWATFAKDNDVDEGDVCVFELINRKDVVLKVTIFHVDEYA